MFAPLLRWRARAHAFWNLACPRCGASAGWRVHSATARMYSYCAPVHCAGCGAAMFLKRHRLPAGVANTDGRREFEILQRLNEESGDRAVAVPRPLALSDDGRTLAMEWVRGATLAQRIRSCRGQAELEGLVNAAGVWLARLHGVNKDLPRSRGREAILAGLEAQDFRPGDALDQAALACLRQTLPEADALPFRHVPLHGDFKASNLLCGEEGVVGIDIEWNSADDGAVDLGQFITDYLLNLRRSGGVPPACGLDWMLERLTRAHGGVEPRSAAWWLLYFLTRRRRGFLAGWRGRLLPSRRYDEALREALDYWERSRLPMSMGR